MANTDPDTLLKGVDKKSWKSDVMLSVLLHILVIGLTSFGLYASWQKWGVHSPSQIKMLEKAAAKEAAKQKADAKAAQEAAAAATNEPIVKVEKRVERAPSSAAPVKADEAEKLPLDKQVETPPKTFDSLDVIDL